MNRFLLGLIALLALIATPALAQLPPDLAQAAHAYEAAQIGGDGAAMQRLMADDYVLVGGDGTRSTKAQLIAEFTDPKLKANPVTVREPVEKVWGDAAVIGGLVEFTGTYDGKPIRQVMRFADVWERRDGRWVVVYGQVTRVPEPK
ncbi:MAG: hypothetical protein K0R83_2085 [Caulobacter sp.]|jgi:ketosteroid isomerase-like protein|nr:hypothetical protein [Caulobacter sp.]